MQDYLRILLVDADRNDYLRTRNLLEEAAREYDYNLEWSPNFDTALNAISSAKHDLYLIDFNIGTGKALDLLRKTVESGRRAPAIVVNGHETGGSDLEAMKLGAADFLSKAELKPQSLDRAIRHAFERKSAEEYQQIARAELEHRVKNVFNQILSMARHTMRTVDSLEEFKEIFEKRLMALAQINTLLTQRTGENTSLKNVVQLFAESWEKIAVKHGEEEIPLARKTARSLYTALNELSIISVKHGALSDPAGSVALSWERKSDSEVVMRWIESGGPEVYYPEKTGGARKLIELMVEGQLRGSLDFGFKQGGISCEMKFKAETDEPRPLRS